MYTIIFIGTRNFYSSALKKPMVMQGPLDFHHTHTNQLWSPQATVWPSNRNLHGHGVHWDNIEQCKVFYNKKNTKMCHAGFGNTEQQHSSWGYRAL